MKKITWENVIDIVRNMHDINQAEIGRILGVDRSTITKLIKGTQSCLNLSKDRDFLKVFYYGSKDSESERKQLLAKLNESIKDIGLINETKDLKTNDFESFARNLIKAANKKPACPSKQVNMSSPNTNNNDHTQQNNDTSPGKISDASICDFESFAKNLIKAANSKSGSSSPNIKPQQNNDKAPGKISDDFTYAYKGYGIESFINCDPIMLSTIQLEDVSYFIGYINPSLRQIPSAPKEYLDKNKPLYQKIMNYTEILNDYLYFLKNYTTDKANFPLVFCLPSNINSNYDYINEANNYRDKLICLAKEINTIIENEKAKEREESKNRNKVCEMPTD